MTIYDCLNFVIIVSGTLMTKFKLFIGKKEINGKFCFFILTAFLLIFLSAFRGDFSADYNNYVQIYRNFSGLPLGDIFRTDTYGLSEKGYLVFQYLVRLIFNDYSFIFIISSIIVVMSNLLHLIKYSDNYFLAVMLFLVIGMYYVSFTIIRQCMAASIIILGSKFLYERKTLKYLFIVFLACTFHTSAIIMIPFYFIANTKINRKYFFIYLILFTALLRALPEVISIVRIYYWDWYTLSARDATNWKTIVLPTLLSLIAFANYVVNRKTDFHKENASIIQNSKDDVIHGDVNNIWLNGTFLYLYFKFCGLFLDLADRFAVYFSIYAICFYVHQISKSKYRKLFTFLSFLTLIIYEIYITHTPYYFIWES